MPGGLSIFRAFRSGSNPFLFPLFKIFLDISLKWWGREQLPTGFHHLFLSLKSKKSPVSVAQATETFTTAENIGFASLRLASYLPS